MAAPDSTALEVASMRLRCEDGRFRAVEVGADVLTIVAKYFVESAGVDHRARVTLLGLFTLVHFRRVCKAFCAAVKCAAFPEYDGAITQRPAPSVAPLTDAEAAVAADEHPHSPDPLNAWHQRLNLTGGKRLAIGVHHFDARSQCLSGETACPWDLYAVRERETSRVRILAVRNALAADHERRLPTAAAPSCFIWDERAYTNTPLHDDHHEAMEGKWADYRWYEPQGAVLHEFDALKLVVVMSTRDTTRKPQHYLSSAIREASTSARERGSVPVAAPFDCLNDICAKAGLTALHGAGPPPSGSCFASLADATVLSKTFRPTPAERAGVHPYSQRAKDLNCPLEVGDVETMTQVGFSRSVNLRAYTAPHVPYRLHHNQPGYDLYKDHVWLHPHIHLTMMTRNAADFVSCVEDVTLLPVSGYMNETLGADVESYDLNNYLAEARKFYSYPSELMRECGYDAKPAILNSLASLNPLKRIPELPSMLTTTLRDDLGIENAEAVVAAPRVRWPHHEHTFLKKSERADAFFSPDLEKLSKSMGVAVPTPGPGTFHLSHASSVRLAVPASTKAAFSELARYAASLTLQSHFVAKADKTNAALAANRAAAAAGGSTALVAFDERHAPAKPQSVLTAESRKQIRKAASAPSSFRGAKIKAVMGIANHNASNSMVMHNGRSVGADVDSENDDDPSLIDDATASAEDIAMMDAGAVPRPECELSDSDDSEYDPSNKAKRKKPAKKKRKAASKKPAQPKKVAKKAGKAKAAAPAAAPVVDLTGSSDEDENSEDEREARASPTLQAPPPPAVDDDESEDELDAMFS